jgi:hypothetical protein
METMSITMDSSTTFEMKSTASSADNSPSTPTTPLLDSNQVFNVPEGKILVSPEDIVLKRKLREKILREIEKLIQLQIDTPVEYDSGTESRNSSGNGTAITSLKKYIFPNKTFRLMDDNGYLPKVVKGGRARYELHQNILVVELASPMHDTMSNTFAFNLTLWSSNGGTGPRSIWDMGQSCSFPL